MSEKTSWTTQDELDYINKIGEHIVNRPGLNRKAGPTEQFKMQSDLLKHKHKILNGYYEGIKQRAFWGDINKKVVFDFVEKQIFKKG